MALRLTQFGLRIYNANVKELQVGLWSRGCRLQLRLLGLKICFRTLQVRNISHF